MNDTQSENKVRQDGAKVITDLHELAGDSAAGFTRYEGNIGRVTSKAKDGLATWVEGGVSQFNQGREKLTGEAKEALLGAATSVTKDVGHGLSEYNAKAQKVADQVPGAFGEKAAKYPWVAMSIALTVGFLLGMMLKPARQPLG